MWEEAWRIVFDSTSFTSHSLRSGATEHWSIELLEKVLPRHLELIYLINFYFIEHLKELRIDEHKISALSLVDEAYPKSIKFANLCFYCAHETHGVTHSHVQNLKRGLFQDFNEVFPGRLTCITTIVNPVRWIHCANRPLSEFLTQELGGDNSWLKDLKLLKAILSSGDSPSDYGDW